MRISSWFLCKKIHCILVVSKTPSDVVCFAMGSSWKIFERVMSLKRLWLIFKRINSNTLIYFVMQHCICFTNRFVAVRKSVFCESRQLQQTFKKMCRCRNWCRWKVCVQSDWVFHSNFRVEVSRCDHRIKQLSCNVYFQQTVVDEMSIRCRWDAGSRFCRSNVSAEHVGLNVKMSTDTHRDLELNLVHV